MEVRMRGQEFISGLKISLLTWHGRLKAEQDNLLKDGDLVKCDQCANTCKNGLCIDCLKGKIRLAEALVDNAKLHYDN